MGSVPKRIHICWNASEAYEYFGEHGISATSGDLVTPTQITDVIGHEVGRLFCLSGWFGEPPVDVTLKLRDRTDTGLLLANITEPTFKGLFVVAEEPPPLILTPHGDLMFDLLNTEHSA